MAVGGGKINRIYKKLKSLYALINKLKLDSDFNGKFVLIAREKYIIDSYGNKLYDAFISRQHFDECIEGLSYTSGQFNILCTDSAGHSRKTQEKYKNMKTKIDGMIKKLKDNKEYLCK